jgi:hypothetical protein
MLLRHLSAGPPVRCKGGGHHHLCTPAGPIHKGEDRADEPAVPLEEMGDRKPSQSLRHLRSLILDVPDYFLRTVWTS